MKKELETLKEEVLSGKYGTKNRVQLLLRIEGLLEREKEQQSELDFIWIQLGLYYRHLTKLSEEESTKLLNKTKKVFNQ